MSGSLYERPQWGGPITGDEVRWRDTKMSIELEAGFVLVGAAEASSLGMDYFN